MKKELKDIILVGTIASLLIAGIIIASVLLDNNAFDKGKSVSLRISYASKDYFYENIKTTEQNLYEFLVECNDRLALDMEISSMGNNAMLYSLKDTQINYAKNTKYRVSINGEEQNSLLGVQIADGDMISIEYIAIDSKDGTIRLAEGGNDSLTFYDKASIAIYALIATIVIPVIAYIVVAIIKLRNQNRIV